MTKRIQTAPAVTTEIDRREAEKLQRAFRYHGSFCRSRFTGALLCGQPSEHRGDHRREP